MAFSGFTITQIVEASGGRLANSQVLSNGFETGLVTRLAALDEAKEGDLAFFFAKKYQHELLKAAPSVLVTAEPFVEPIAKSGLPLWKKTAVISCADPYLAMAVLSEKFAPSASTVAHVPGTASAAGPTAIHASAVISPAARIGDHVKIGAYCVVEEGARIGNGTVLYPGCFVGPGAQIGKDCVLFPRVTLYERVQLGDRVRIHAGAVLGADGFGYAARMKDDQIIGHQKIYHLGTVVVGDDVEVGANTCIDRGTLKNTVIGAGCKIDDDVMIGHNCQLGEGVILCGSVGLAGSVEIGNYVYIGGMSGIPNGVHVGDRAKLGGGTFVSGNIPAGETVGGHPHRKFRDFLKLQVLLSRLLEDHRAERKKSE